MSLTGSHLIHITPLNQNTVFPIIKQVDFVLKPNQSITQLCKKQKKYHLCLKLTFAKYLLTMVRQHLRHTARD